MRQLFGDEYREEFIVPTTNYHPIVSKATTQFAVRGMAHVAGGAFYRLKDMVGNTNTDLVILRCHSLKTQPIFQEIYSRGVKDEDMYKTFNCGMGFLMGMSKEDAVIFTTNLRESINADIVGAVLLGKGLVKIQSQFSKNMVVY